MKEKDIEAKGECDMANRSRTEPSGLWYRSVGQVHECWAGPSCSDDYGPTSLLDISTATSEKFLLRLKDLHSGPNG